MEFSLSHQGLVLMIFGELAFPGLQEIPGHSLVGELLHKITSQLLGLRHRVPRGLAAASLIAQALCPLTLFKKSYTVPHSFVSLDTLFFSMLFSLLTLLCLSIFSTPVLGTSLQWSLINHPSWGSRTL